MFPKMRFGVILCLFVSLIYTPPVYSQTVSDLIGVNAQAKQMIDDQLQQMSSVREYHYWSSDQVDPDFNSVEECPDTDIRLNPSFDGSAYVNYDSWYTLFSGAAWPAANGALPGMFGEASTSGFPFHEFERKPICKEDYTAQIIKRGEDILNPIYQSEVLPELTNDGVAFWIEPLFGKSGETSKLILKTSGFNNVTAFQVIIGFSDKLFSNNSNYSLHPNIASANFEGINYRIKINSTSTNPVQIADGEVLATIYLETKSGSEAPTGVYTLSFNSGEGSENVTSVTKNGNSNIELIVPDSDFKILESNEIGFSLVKDGVQNVCAPTASLYDVKAFGFKDINDFGLSIGFNPSLFTVPSESDCEFNISGVGIDLILERNIFLVTSINSGNTLSEVPFGNIIGSLELNHLCNSGSPIPGISTPLLGNGENRFREIEASSWKEHALWLTMLSAHYGSGNFSPGYSNIFYPSLVNSYDQEAMQLSTGILSTIENYNEPDKTWREPGNTTPSQYALGDTDFYMSPEQFAAMTSCDYDGHESTVKHEVSGQLFDIGVKNADPNMQMVMGGLAGLKVSYIKSMIEWFNYNRPSGGLAFDALNVHFYCNDGEVNMDDPSSGQFGSYGKSPEESGLITNLELFMNALEAFDSRLTSIPFWMTEFGYDSDPSSPQAALPEKITLSGGLTEIRPGVNELFDISKYTIDDQAIITSAVEKAQADWIIRYVLEMSAARSNTLKGFEKGNIFTLIDDKVTGNTDRYATSGLIRSDFSPKKSWFWALTLNSVLGSYTFSKDLSTQISSCSDSRVYKYSSPTLADIYTVWDSDADDVSDICNLNFSGEIAESLDEEKTIVITFQDGDENGKRQSLGQYIDSQNELGYTISVAGKFILGVPISATPTFIIPDGKTEFPADSPLPCPTIVYLASTSCNSAIYKWEPMSGIEKYQIYSLPAAPVPNNQTGPITAPPFDLSNRDLRLVADNIRGSFSSYVFESSAESCSREWTYLVATSASGVRSDVCGFSLFNKKLCGCSIEINPEWIVDKEGNSLATEIGDIFDTDELNDLCNLPKTVNSNWGLFESNEFILDFHKNSGKALRLNFINFLDDISTGQFDIYGSYFDGSVNNIVEVKLFSYRADNYQKWQFVGNQSYLDKQFASLRFIRSNEEFGYASGSQIKTPNIPKIIICGKLEEYGLLVEQDPNFPISSSSPAPTVIWKDGPKAEVTFDKEFKYYNTEETGRIEEYSILHSNELDERGNLLNPEEVRVKNDNSSLSITTVIDSKNLDPATTKFRLRIWCNCPEYALELVPSSQFRLSSTDVNEFRIFPNPTSSWITLKSVGDKNIIDYKITTNGGQIVQSAKLEKPQNQWMINLSDRQGGLYFITVVFEDGSKEVRKFVVARN